MGWKLGVFILLLATTLAASIKKKKLTIAGTVVAGLSGIVIFAGTDFAGIAMIGLFFVIGVLVTSSRMGSKMALGVAEKDAGKRTAAQVFANGGVATLCGAMALVMPAFREPAMLMMAGALSAATADTVSSELGTVYGKRFYNVLDLRPGRRGDNGVISLEGLLFGLAGSCIIAITYCLFNKGLERFAWILVAGTLGNLADSVLGAVLERKGMLNNDQVNFLNTAVGASVTYILMQVVG